MTADQKKQIRQLYHAGMPYREIAARIGMGITSVHTYLLKAGLSKRERRIMKQKPEFSALKTPEFVYSLPHLYDDQLDALTDNQKEERRIAELRAFEIHWRRRLSAAEAARIFHLSYRELEQEFGITTEQAKIMVNVAKRIMTVTEMEV